MPEKLYIVDGHAQTYRAFYAVEGLKSPDGMPTGAAYGFTRMMIDTIDKHKPDYFAVVFDMPGPTFRHKEYPEYKANRKPAPPELHAQIPVIKDIISAFNIPIYGIDGYEADDVLATIAKLMEKNGVETVIVSGDKDLAQVLRDGVTLYDPRKDLFTSAADFIEKNGVEPRLLPDVMGLWGDASDNIPGVPGIGQKGALQLIAEHGNLDNLLKKSALIGGKRGKNLRAFHEQALLSRKLALICEEAPVEFDLEKCRLPEPNLEKIYEIYDQLGFHSLKKKTMKVFGTESSTSEKSGDSGKPAPWEAEKVERTYKLINTPELFAEFYEELKKQSFIAFDVETTSTDPMQAELVGMSFSWKEGEGFYLPVKAPEGEAVLGSKELEIIKGILEDENVGKTGHNLKYDSLVMRRNGVELKGIKFDSMLVSHLLAGHIRGHSMDACAERYLHETTVHIEELIGKGKKQITMDQVPLEKVSEYASEDADISLRLKNHLAEKLSKENELQNLFDDIELPLSLVLTDMQYEGIRLDCDLLNGMSADMEKQLELLTGEIHFLAGEEFNIASPKQLSEILFDKLGFRIVKKTKTGISTDESVLTELAADEHPKRDLPRLILKYRGYSKLKSTYLDALPQMVNPHTGRIHTTFHQTGTATGRLSSSDPNLQNIPVRTEEGRGIRAAFVPREGWKMVAADYSQVELRVLAHLSGDRNMVQAFVDGKDIHRAVAAQVWKVSEDEVTSDQRRAAKAVNFGLIYGQSAFGLSQATDMNRGEAQDFINRYFAEYPDVKKYIDEKEEQASADGYVTTILGRKREIPELSSTNHMRRMHARRMALNTIIQGSAADLVKKAMIEIHHTLKESNSAARILLQIHDELVLECPPEEAEALAGLIKDKMEKALSLTVPLVADTGTGDNWLEVK